MVYEKTPYAGIRKRSAGEAIASRKERSRREKEGI